MGPTSGCNRILAEEIDRGQMLVKDGRITPEVVVNCSVDNVIETKSLLQSRRQWVVAFRPGEWQGRTPDKGR